jgi:hypothetical protein
VLFIFRRSELDPRYSGIGLWVLALAKVLYRIFSLSVAEFFENKSCLGFDTKIIPVFKNYFFKFEVGLLTSPYPSRSLQSKLEYD